MAVPQGVDVDVETDVGSDESSLVTVIGEEFQAKPCVLEAFLAAFPESNYGFIVVAAAIIGTWTAAPGHSFVMGIFTESIVKDVGISRSVSTHTIHTIS